MPNTHISYDALVYHTYNTHGRPIKPFKASMFSRSVGVSVGVSVNYRSSRPAAVLYLNGMTHFKRGNLVLKDSPAPTREAWGGWGKWVRQGGPDGGRYWPLWGGRGKVDNGRLLQLFNRLNTEVFTSRSCVSYV